MEKVGELTFFKLNEFKEGDVVIPRKYVVSDKYLDEVLYAGHASSFLVINNMNELGNLIHAVMDEFDYASYINYHWNKNNFDFVKIGEFHSVPFYIKGDFFIFRKKKYKHCLLVGNRKIVYNVNFRFPFIHVKIV